MNEEQTKAPDKSLEISINEFKAGFNTLQWLMHRNADEKGFHDIHREIDEPAAAAVMITNIHGEVSELWEAFRSGKQLDACDKNCTLTNAEEELADIVIRVMDMAQFYNIGLADAIIKKHVFNTGRPHMHGGKLA